MDMLLQEIRLRLRMVTTTLARALAMLSFKHLQVA